MQYFTFLGVGSENGYSQANYFFQDNINIECQSKYIQMAIVERYLETIDDIYVFCTQISYEKNKTEFLTIIQKKYQKEIHFIIINDDVSTEDILLEMNKVLKEDFIIDITHSFRNIPITVTLITRYLEYSKNYKLLHLYYGNYNKDTHQGKIVDLIEQYHNSKLINELESFDKHLKTSSHILNGYEDDKKVMRLLNSFIQFNRMIEYCEFDNSINCVRNIVESSKSILKESYKYILIVPYVEKIIQKFEVIIKSTSQVSKKINLIKILLDNELIQISITFTDQLIREELVHYAYFANVNDFHVSMLKELGRNIELYNLSQDLLYALKIRNGQNNPKKYIQQVREQYLDMQKNIQVLDRKCIDYFYTSIRNVINHGGQIHQSVDVKSVIYKCLESLEKFIKEG